MIHPTDHKIVKTKINGFLVRLTSYRIGEIFHCHIDNIDPGATISRGSGQTLEHATSEAMEKAQNRLVSK
jgi:hypothetical protein